MSEAAIRTLLKAVLDTVTDIGMTYDHEVYTNTEAGMRQYFKATIGGVDQVRGCMIGRKSFSEETHTTAAPNIYAINCYLGLQESTESEKVLNALVEAIRTALRADLTIHAAGYAKTPIQGGTMDVRSFGGFLCNHAELTITVWDFVP